MKLGIMVITDEVYSQTIFGDNPFVPMGEFSSIAPVITLGGISKGWIVPGWRIGWIALHDPKGIFKSTGVCLSLSFQISIIGIVFSVACVTSNHSVLSFFL